MNNDEVIKMVKEAERLEDYPVFLEEEDVGKVSPSMYTKQDHDDKLYQRQEWRKLLRKGK